MLVRQESRLSVKTKGNMAEDSNGNFIVADGKSFGPLLPVGSRAVSVYHTGQNPLNTLLAPKEAVAIGTGQVHGFVWIKKSQGLKNTDWVQVLP